MLSAPTPENDEKRISSLRDMTLLSTPREADLDRLTRIAILWLLLNDFTQLHTGPIVLVRNLSAIARKYLASAMDYFLVALDLRHDSPLLVEGRVGNWKLHESFPREMLDRASGESAL